MRCLRSPPLPLILLLGLALLLTRVTGTHLHLDLDETQTPVVVHVADDGSHHAEHQGDDVDVGDTSAAKSWQQSPVAGLLFIGIALLRLPVAPAPPLPRSGTASLPRRKLPHILRPPLRGPPLIASLA